MDILRTLLANPVATGLMGASGVGVVLVQLRAIPGRVIGAVRDQFTVTVHLTESDDLLSDFDEWMAEHPYSKKARTLVVPANAPGRISYAYPDKKKSEPTKTALSPGLGSHLIWHKHRPFWIHRSQEKPQPGGGRPKDLTIMTLGRSQKPIRDFLGEISTHSLEKPRVRVWVWARGEYCSPTERRPRSLETIFLHGDIKKDVLGDLEWFLENEEWFAKRGIPHRRGYLLEGPPGTGKTSLIFALASAVGKPIHLINTSDLKSDGELLEAMNDSYDGIVVIEDIDCMDAPVERDADGKKLTMSGLLNAIDGLGSQDGRILFITSNRPEKIDLALLRPGRIDRRFHLGYMQIEEAREMFLAFYPEGDIAAFEVAVTPHLPISAARLQGELLVGESLPGLLRAA